MQTSPTPRTFLVAVFVSAMVSTAAQASEPAPSKPATRTAPNVSLDKARALAKAACDTAVPLISPFADAVSRFSETVKTATKEHVEALKTQLAELQAAAEAPARATDAATTAYESFSKLVNRRRTISHRDLALAARFKSVRYSMRKARRALAKAAKELLNPPESPKPAP